MRDAQVLILDEPTASLDARSEHEVFEAFFRTHRGLYTVLVSHHFSTVRIAQRIAEYPLEHWLELDPDAIGNAEANVRANGVSDRVVVIEGEAASLLPLVAPVRVILANIISSALIALLPAMRSALMSGGVAIFSGILVDEREAFVSALERGRWLVQREDVEDVWWTVVARPE